MCLIRRFLENVDSEIFDNIVRVVGCEKSEIHDVYPLKQGLTNLSCHFSTASGEYVYRHPGVGTELLIDRKGEVAAQQTARELGIDGTFIFEDPERGWKRAVSYPIAPISTLMIQRRIWPRRWRWLETCMRAALRSHVALTFIRSRRYESLLREHGPIDIPGFADMAGKIEDLEAFVKADNAPTCLCHNDFFYLNFLVEKDGAIHLIDWEYAGMGDYANDFGTFCVCCELDESEADAALTAYFGRKPTIDERRHNFAHVALAGWLVSGRF